jgi:hypothetical protein
MVMASADKVSRSRASGTAAANLHIERNPMGTSDADHRKANG